MDFLYREATVEDSTQLEELESKIFTYPHSKEQLEFEIKSSNYVYYICESNGIIIGCIGLQHVIDEGYITNIAVIPIYRGNGISIELMKLLISKSLELKLSFISLEVRQSNSVAINLYKKFNFDIVSKLSGYYSKPKEDGLIMTLRL